MIGGMIEKFSITKKIPFFAGFACPRLSDLCVFYLYFTYFSKI